MKTFFSIFFIPLFLWLIAGFSAYYSFDNWSDRGTFGDMFGAVNALFSGLAFAGLIYSIIIQRKELALQREELALQRDEISKSTAELAGQKDLMDLQRFENTFLIFFRYIMR